MTPLPLSTFRFKETPEGMKWHWYQLAEADHISKWELRMVTHDIHAILFALNRDLTNVERNTGVWADRTYSLAKTEIQTRKSEQH